MNNLKPCPICNNYHHFDTSCPELQRQTTPTTPSEWEKELDEATIPFHADIANDPNGMITPVVDLRETIAFFKGFIRKTLHHNTEDIIEQCAKEAEEWLDDTEADETVKAILRVVAKQIRALKPKHKE